MNWTAVVVALLMATGLFGGVWLYTARTIYDVVAARGTAYVVNRATGEAWWILGTKRREVDAPEQSPPKRQTLDELFGQKGKEVP